MKSIGNYFSDSSTLIFCYSGNFELHVYNYSTHRVQPFHPQKVKSISVLVLLKRVKERDKRKSFFFTCATFNDLGQLRTTLIK